MVEQKYPLRWLINKTDRRMSSYVCKELLPDFDEYLSLQEHQAIVEKIERKVQPLIEALKSVESRGKRTGGCSMVTTETLRSIAKQALANYLGEKG